MRKQKGKNGNIVVYDSLIVVMIPFLPNRKAAHYGAEGDEGKSITPDHKEVIDRARDDLKHLSEDKREGWGSFKDALLYPHVIYLGEYNQEDEHSLKAAIKFFCDKTNSSKDKIKNLAINISAHGNPKAIGSIQGDNIPPDGTAGLPGMVTSYIEDAQIDKNTSLSFYFRTCNSAFVEMKGRLSRIKLNKKIETLEKESKSAESEEEKKKKETELQILKKILDFEIKEENIDKQIESKGKSRQDEKEIRKLEREKLGFLKQKQKLKVHYQSYIGKFARDIDLPNIKKVSGHVGYIGYHKGKMVGSNELGKMEKIAGASELRVFISGDDVSLSNNASFEVEGVFNDLLSPKSDSSAIIEVTDDELDMIIDPTGVRRKRFQMPKNFFKQDLHTTTTIAVVKAISFLMIGILALSFFKKNHENKSAKGNLDNISEESESEVEENEIV